MTKLNLRNSCTCRLINYVGKSFGIYNYRSATIRYQPVFFYMYNIHNPSKNQPDKKFHPMICELETEFSTETTYNVCILYYI